MRAHGPVAIYDPHNFLAAFDALYPLDGIELAALYVQDVEQVGRVFRDQRARPVTELAAEPRDHGARRVLRCGASPSAHIKPLMRNGASLSPSITLRLPDDMLSDSKRYLSNLNFATNFVFFRDADGHHTRLATANYWGNYGGKGGYLWFLLFDDERQRARRLARDAARRERRDRRRQREVRTRFALPDFTGQLFVHVVGAAGHDVVKYALDTYGDAPHVLSCTHDANSWPADRYAGLPAPAEGEEVMLWVQNSHPVPIPTRARSASI